MNERLEFKADFTIDDAGTISGVAWLFGQPDRVGDMIEPGAFSSAKPPVPMLFAHDQKQAVGVWDTIVATARGLEVTGRLLVKEVARAAEVYALVKEQAARGLSIGFVTKKSAPRKGGRLITQLDLVELSIVPAPMHPGARIETVKGAGDYTMTEAAEQTADSGDAIPAAVETKFAEIGDQLKAVDKLTKRLDSLEVKINRPAAGGSKSEDEASAIERKAFTTFLRKGREALGADEIKSLRVADDTSGGYIATSEFSREVDKNLVQFSPIRQAVRVGSTSSGSVIIPRRIGKPSAYWVGESEARSPTQSSYGQVEIPIDEIGCYVEVSNKLLEDAAVDVAAEVAFDLAEEFGRAEGEALLVGNGFKRPLGLLNDAGVSYTASGVANSLFDATHNGIDALLDLYYSLAPFYRQRGVWLANGKTIAALRKIKSKTEELYLWQPSVAAGQPDLFLGKPVVEAVDMPDIAENTFPIIFGDFASAMRLYERTSLSLLRDPYSAAAEGLTRFHARRRVGARVVRPEAVRKLKISAS
ncbi:MAG: phage major capsid protein [Methylacidiphilales bacterium]|nr:phage major capsid protein [Candidatus Methylacidiphilales bacterium]